jgi:hypothetical protein
LQPSAAPAHGRDAPRVRRRWNNGHRYYDRHGKELRVPADPDLRPSLLALEWHREHVFERLAG